MEDMDADIESMCYVMMHDALTQWLRPLVRDLVRIHSESCKVNKKRKKNPGAMVRDIDVQQVLELRGITKRDTYFQRLLEGRVLRSDSALLGGDDPKDGEQTPYRRALAKAKRRIIKAEGKEPEFDPDEDDLAAETTTADVEAESQEEHEVADKNNDSDEDEPVENDEVDSS